MIGYCTSCGHWAELDEYLKWCEGCHLDWWHAHGLPEDLPLPVQIH